MPAMRLRRRLVALLALLAVAWTSLWPLVAAAHARMASEAMPLCHMAGMAVEMDSPGQPPAAPGHPQPKFHCPLCIMAFYGAFSAPRIPQPAAFTCRRAERDPYCASQPRDVSRLLPQSRAPPALA
jgi:hypothetical protein